MLTSLCQMGRIGEDILPGPDWAEILVNSKYVIIVTEVGVERVGSASQLKFTILRLRGVKSCEKQGRVCTMSAQSGPGRIREKRCSVFYTSQISPNQKILLF